MNPAGIIVFLCYKSEMEQPSWSILRDDTGLESAMERWEEDDDIHD